MNRRWLVWFALLICVSVVTCSHLRAPGRRSIGRPGYLETRARSMILFIGDGMGPQIVSIAKIYSERTGRGELNMVRLANTGTAGYVATHSRDKLVTDSAASGTAIATGQRTNNGMVGMSPEGERLTNIFEEAVDNGKSVGVVTTTSITDATPASFLAHALSREQHFEIAEQIVESDASVIMGGGYWYFLPSDKGRRRDDQDLTEYARERGFDVAFDKKDLEASSGDRLLGLFAADVLPFERERPEDQIPSVSDMVEKALAMLEIDPDGFLLVVEGGRIDHAEHENRIADAIEDLYAFDEAIGKAMSYQQADPTLTIVVTADHDCAGPAISASFYGYPSYDDLESLVDKNSPFMQWTSDAHTATMVPVFARGPGAEAFSGIQDNTELHYDIVRLLGF